uniref:phosphoserine phosphatase SerB n=1 Tax=Paenirhodobacter enshiensis TaxID=1105367 RepID=UPI0035AEC06F
MYIATLLAAPSAANLDAATLDGIVAGWAGSAPRWLKPGVAAEFDLEAMPADRWAVWEALQAQRIDMVVQPAAGRRKKMLLADMDSTMIQQECIDELADVAGVGARVKEITARAMNGELDFEGALTERVGLLKGLPETVIARVIEERLSFTPGGRELIATMKADGAYCALVSGGFTAFTGHVAGALGFHENRANTLLIEDGVLTGVPARPILGREAKVQAFHEISERLGLRADEVMAVGDGANDLGMLHLAGTGVALHAKPSVAAQCDVRVNFGDLTALLYLQGYAEADFVTA